MFDLTASGLPVRQRRRAAADPRGRLRLHPPAAPRARPGCEILGDGSQSKSYIHVDDVLDALLLLHERGWNGFDVFNVATEDYVTVRQIADLVAERLGISGVEYAFTGGDRGWKGDVPVVRFDSDKLRGLGWSNRRTSVEALRDAIDSMIVDARAGKFEQT